MENNTTTLEGLKARSRWLMAYAHNTYSQYGEDGIIAKALELLPAGTRHCVEFGAWDGRHLSNTFRLVSECGFHVVLIEADGARFRELQASYPHRDRATMLNAVVGFSAADGLDSLLSKTTIPREFDLLSIDIDGNDYHVWDCLQSYRPRMVLIEYNPTMSNTMGHVQAKRPDVSEGSSALSIVNLGHLKGYELIAVTEINLLFVASEYFPLFGIPDNSLALMRDDSKCPHIYVGYDGRVRLFHNQERGLIHLPWHGMQLREEHIQVLPSSLQKYRDAYSGLDRLHYRIRFGRLRQLLRWLTGGS